MKQLFTHVTNVTSFWLRLFLKLLPAISWRLALVKMPSLQLAQNKLALQWAG
jgi:hypothetical protein